MIAFKSKDWCGHIGHSPYLALIANGQWGAFLHVQGVGKFEGSVGNVHIENRPAEHYVSNVGWIPIIYDGLNQYRIYKSETWGGCMSTISTGIGTSPIVEAILTLEDA
ncbi:uncharacterized protein LOC109947387 [Prunus persica]|uniref:uncharacterized protein LOC109947387 n=1 Tax=Prunus persica TaxID=3760 RepID=UPI0009AB72D8|nr:uncharacterized protein LOC109947387 [Prunus persica]